MADFWFKDSDSQFSRETELIGCVYMCIYIGASQAFSGRESACQAGDMSLIPGSGRSPGGGHGNSLQYPCLENPMDRGAWRAIVLGVTKSRTGLSD